MFPVATASWSAKGITTAADSSVALQTNQRQRCHKAKQCLERHDVLGLLLRQRDTAALLAHSWQGWVMELVS